MSDSKPIFVLYHANCADGFGAAWAAWMHYKDLATYLPVSYGEPVPEGIPDGARVFIVDFSFPREVLLGLNDRCAVTVIDHHKTAEEALRGLDFARFDLTKSGAVLTWEYFHKEPVPEMLLYVQDRDLWQWKMGFSKEINACLWRGATRDFQTWRVIHQLWHAGADSSVEDLYAGGKAICLADALTIEVLVRKPAWVRVLGWMVPAVNSPVLQSEIGHELLQRHAAAPFALVWWVESDGRHGFSARARGGEDGFDVSVLAKEFGGGGHRAAAGFKRDSMFEFVTDDIKDSARMSGAQMIADERARQLNVEGWTAAHDDGHDYGQLAAAALVYVDAHLIDITYKPEEGGRLLDELLDLRWPFDEGAFKLSPSIRMLTKAGALIAAEIDRVKREEGRTDEA